jgi:S-adenosylmethionine hydrolase
MAIITLLTDFGTRDPFVGVMKGVMLSIAPGATLVDLTHDVLPQDIAQGAFLLGDSVGYFPPGTVHLAVVDPGVGGSRRPLAVHGNGHFFVGPDNGLFTDVMALSGAVEAVELANARYRRPDVSATFHGRDVFAPAAAHLAAGVPLSELGPRVTNPVRLPPPVVTVEADHILAQVLHVDTFGNALTTLKTSVLQQWLGPRPHAGVHVRCGRLLAHGLVRTFSDVEVGAPVAYPGSSGVLELAIRNGNAAGECGFSRGTPVEVTFSAGS